jgi:Pescadillo N-terminus
MLTRGLSTPLHSQRYPLLRAIQSTNGLSCSFPPPGIFPREPKHKKRANKGSSAPTSFYYTKDIAFLQHEPVLKKLREHKAFAKKLSRALGRGEWSSAKSLEANKPTYRLDHIIKERYVLHKLLIPPFIADSPLTGVFRIRALVLTQSPDIPPSSMLSET